MNVLDRIVYAISPTTALKRQVARKQLEILNAGYGDHGASHTKKSLIGWRVSGGSVKEDIDDNLVTLRERSRDLYMGVPLATGALKSLRTNVVGSGLRLSASIDVEALGMTEEEAEAWENKVEREFALWANTPNCDAQRMNNFYELQQVAFLSWMMSGDAFVLLPVIPRPQMPYDLRVHLIEADRVCTPLDKIGRTNIINGVETGQYGEPVAYWVADKHPSSTDLFTRKWVRVEAYGARTGRPNILHLMESERPEQRRGVPILAPVIESLKQLGRYTEAELMAAVVSGMFTVFIKNVPSPGETQLGEAIHPEEQIAADDQFSYELGNGAIVALGDREDISVANPGRPNPVFDPFVTSILRQVGAALEIPYELLIRHFTASYSASRAALLEAWKMFKMRRAWLSADFCQPIYEEWLSEAVAKGRISAPGFFNDPIIRQAYCGAEWSGPSQGQIDPLREVKAAEERVQGGYSTRSREAIELTGSNWNQNIRQRIREERVRREGGLVISGQGQGAKEVLDIPKPDED